MSDINRSEISEVLAQSVSGNTIEERNSNRRELVVEFLNNRTSITWLQGSSHDMILSDLESYPEWEREDDRDQTRSTRPRLRL